MTELLAIVLYGSIVTFFLSIVVFGIIILYKLKRRNSVHATIFLKSGSQTKFLFDRKKRVQRNINNKSYVLNELGVHKTAWRDYIYYYEDNSEPIIFDHKTATPRITSSELNSILNDDLISKLFNQGEIATLKLLVYIILGTLVINVLISGIILMRGVPVKITPELVDMVYNTTRRAVMGV